MSNKNFQFIRSLNTLLTSKKNIQKRKIILILFVTSVIFLFIFLFSGSYGIINITSLLNERKELEKKIESLEKETIELNEKIKRVETDDSEIERIAREKYGMAKKGEKVYKFVKPQ